MKLIEIIIAISLISLLSFVSFTTYSHYAEQKEFDISTTHFIHIIDFAKKFSIMRDQVIYVCTSTNEQSCSLSWQGQFIVYSSDNPKIIEHPIRRFAALANGITLTITGLKKPPVYFIPDSESTNNSTITLKLGKLQQTLKLSKTGILSKEN